MNSNLKSRLSLTVKRLTVFLLTIAGLCSANAQNSNAETDSAIAIVTKYMNLLNYDALKSDSILYIETNIYKRSNSHDTAILKRWFMQPNLFRAELWHGDTLLQGCYSDGRNIHKEHNLSFLPGWTEVAPSRYYTIAPGYDFRGALHYWKDDGTELRYDGIWDYNGHNVYKIYAESPERYNRYYYFEKESGLLFLIEETQKHSAYSNHQAYDHPDLHGYHEYQPLGNVVLPSIESYQMGGDVLLYYSSFRYIPIDKTIFQQDTPAK